MPSTFEAGALRSRRAVLGLTQAELANHLGVSANTVARWERGEQRVSAPRSVAALLERLERASSLTVPGRRPENGRALGRRGESLSALPAPVVHRLPAQLSSFVGREPEVVEVQRILAAARLLTLTGLGGIGKTRLALEVAGASPGEAVFVDLGPLDRDAPVAEAVAAMLGVVGTPGEDLPTTLGRVLRTRPLLVVLDNCEHLVAQCAELVDGLLRVCPELRVLATSREPLGVAGEVVWTVPPLPVPKPDGGESTRNLGEVPAVRLFVERAQSSLPGFVLDRANAAAVTSICRQVEGIPLALELAAARVRTLGLTELASRLDDRLRLLVGSNRSAPTRQQTLRATLDWSYALLDEPERALLARLAVFAGGWTLQAAETVCADEGLDRDAVVELLGRLLDRSLIAAAHAADGSVRYRMLDTVREYAHERLAERSELEAMQRRHADYCCELAERADPELWGPDQVAWLERMQQEMGNVRTALDWSASAEGDPELGLRTAAALFYFWSRSGHLREGRAYLSRLLERYVEPTRTRAWGLHAAANTAWFDGDLETSRAYLKQTEELAEELGDARTLVWVCIGWASLTQAQGDPIGAEACLRRGLELANRAHAAEPRAMHVLLWSFGEAARAQGDLARARGHMEEALASIHIRGQVSASAFIRFSLGHVLLLCGDFAEAVRLELGSLTDRRALHDTLGVSHCFDELAMAAAAAGNLELSTRFFGLASGLRESGGGAPWPLTLAERERALAEVHARLGDEAFEAAWRAGQSLPIDEAVAEATALATGDRASTRQGPAALSGHGPTDRLTPREREVASLVAHGLTNRQIADALVVAERTAANYVEHILSKLGFHTRAQVAAWAAGQRSRPGPNGATAK